MKQILIRKGTRATSNARAVQSTSKPQKQQQSLHHKWDPKHYSVYVVQLEGLLGDAGKDVYVGMTGEAIETRFQNHKKRYKASKYVYKYGQVRDTISAYSF